MFSEDSCTKLYDVPIFVLNLNTIFLLRILSSDLSLMSFKKKLILFYLQNKKFEFNVIIKQKTKMDCDWNCLTLYTFFYEYNNFI